MATSVILHDLKEVLELDFEHNDYVIHLPDDIIVSTQKHNGGSTYVTLFQGWDNLSDKLGTTMYGMHVKNPSRFLYTGFKLGEAIVKSIRLLCH